MDQIRTVIIDPRQLVREGLEKLLCRPLFDVVAAGRTLADAVNSSGMARVDVVVLGHSKETEMEAQVAALRQLPAEPPRPRFVLVTEVEEPDLLRRALNAGVDALLSSDISSKVFRRSLELVALGQRLFPVSLVHAAPAPLQSTAPGSAAPGIGVPGVAVPNVATPGTGKPQPKHPPGLITVLAPLAAAMPKFAAQQPFTQPAAAPPGLPERNALSTRENQVLGYLVRALSNKEIARELQITEGTVKVHIKALLRKVRASNRTEAAIWALANCRRPNQAEDEMADHAMSGMEDRRVLV